MEGLFDLIFSQIGEQIEKSLKESENGEQELLGISDSIDFNISVDGQGNASRQETRRGYGFTIHATAVINEPKNAVFDVNVTSSGGGSISQKGVPTGTPVSGSLKMEGGLCKTTVRGSLHSSIPNTNIKGKLTYNII